MTDRWMTKKDIASAIRAQNIFNSSVRCNTCCKKETGEYHLFRIVVCPECENKRCPKATDHMLECTGSNEPGQEGSIY